MALNTVITKPLGQGFVQVNASEKNGYTRYYKVPQRNAKIFESELKKQNKDMKVLSNVLFFSSVFAGVTGAFIFTRHMESRLNQFLIQTTSGIIAAALCSLGFSKYEINRNNELLKKHRANEIFYRA